MKEYKKWIYAVPAIAALAGLAIYLFQKKKRDPSLSTARFVDLNKYLGTWYDIAHLPASFQQGCFNTTAEYSLNTDGTIKVVNTCNIDSLNGEEEKAEGIATVTDTTTNAKLKVEFLWPFKGDYWILDVGANYEYALVGEPSRKYLWVLSRSTQLDEKILSSLIALANEKGFSTNNLILTKHRLY